MIQPHPRISTLEYLIIFRAHSPGLTNLIQLTLLSAYRQMGWENLTSVSEFFLLGLSQQPEQQWPLFGLFLSMYLVTVMGNLLIILAIAADAHLHTPMFFFLANLSLTDTCFVSTTVPKMLANIWAQSQVISYTGCLSQLYFFLIFGMLEASLLAVMAYDRYKAICYPLHYIMVMSPGLCVFLVSASWVTNALHSLLHTLLMSSLSFCADQEIAHFFCDINPLLSLSCTDPFINELVIFTVGGLTGLVCVLCLVISYAYIFSTILKIPSAQGKRKAFSTCSSHLSVVCLYFGSSFCVYFSPLSNHSAQKGAVASVMYTVVTPMLNPFIYSLRNRDIKSSLKKLMWARRTHSS
ncbi:olfactory receptor 1G1-like [Ovis canadensis]|uniref:olfactory receptor 1G1-like n=1 Tax=Ovis canadensis TaxID=37174 RepID=UPI003751B4B7